MGIFDLISEFGRITATIDELKKQNVSDTEIEQITVSEVEDMVSAMRTSDTEKLKSTLTRILGEQIYRKVLKHE